MTSARVILTVMCVLANACSLVTDLSPLTPDAPADAGSLIEAGQAGQAGDAGEAGEAAPARTFCEQLSSDWGYTYCRDFDDGEPVEFGWDRREVGNDSSISLDTAEPFSEPSSFLAKVGPAAMPCANAFAEKLVAGTFSKVNVSFRVRLGGLDGSSTFEGTYMTVRLSPSGDNGPCDLVFSGNSGSGTLTEEPALVEHEFALRFPLLKAWTKVELQVDRVAGTAQVKIDGEPAFSTEVKLDGACYGSGSVALVPGMWCTQPGTAAIELRIDNIVLSAS